MPAYCPEVDHLPEPPTTTCVSTGVPLFKKMKVLKKFKKKIGLSSRTSDATSLPPLLFNSVCGDNVRIENGGKVARRVESFCKGISFSNRPVKVGERIYVRLMEISTNWSGVIRFGFTSQDPVGLRDALPKYVCPDLTNKPGYWAKALSERYSDEGLVVFYYVTSTGDVHFGINGDERGVFFSGVETRSPLWAMIDVYGNSTAVEFLDPSAQLNNRVRIVCNDLRPGSTTGNSRILNQEISRTLCRLPSTRGPHPEVEQSMAQLAVTPAVAHRAGSPPTVSYPFHRVRGRNVTFNSERTVASRTAAEYSHGYVFGSRPLKPGEQFTIQILETEPIYVGALAFGVTASNPAGLDASDLPEDCDLLIDRPEYWVVSKDVASTPPTGEELTFGLTAQGQITFTKRSGGCSQVIMHVDHSLQLWPFFDIYGNTTKIRSCGISPIFQVPTQVSVERPPVPPNRQQSPSSTLEITTGNTTVTPTPVVRNIVQPPLTQYRIPPPVVFVDPPSSNTPLPLGGNPPQHECTVCYEKHVDSVLYTCGHMCMCYDCALQQWRGRGGGHCPICRAAIRDVIRTYRS